MTVSSILVQILSNLFFDFHHKILTLPMAIYLLSSTFRWFSHPISNMLVRCSYLLRLSNTAYLNIKGIIDIDIHKNSIKLKKKVPPTQNQHANNKYMKFQMKVSQYSKHMSMSNEFGFVLSMWMQDVFVFLYDLLILLRYIFFLDIKLIKDKKV